MLKNITLLPEFLFYEELSVIKIMWYRVELVEKKDPLIQLEASKASSKDLMIF